MQFIVTGSGDDLEGFCARRIGFGRQFVSRLLRSDAPLTVTTPAFCRSAGCALTSSAAKLPKETEASAMAAMVIFRFSWSYFLSLFFTMFVL
ncbi:hypothetical protein AK51_16340 [Serratia nematodiphila DZ0503SBS1]|nr:hypothetical protein AK51_16340 [Serratia nematodiphila DZ0503SBS1]